MFRFISILQRKRRFIRDEKRTLSLFNDFKKTIDTLPDSQPAGKKLLIIRLDDIGDYLLFRNTLPAYKQSPRWKSYQITLLGNAAWKDLFELWDKETVDHVIWLNKKEYLQNNAYKLATWQQLRSEGFQVVVCPSCTRPILLDDLCRLATQATTAFAFHNFTVHSSWEDVSDTLYSEQYEPAFLTHEFFLNQKFANWCCGTTLAFKQPFIPVDQSVNQNDIVCFIGASTRSKRWKKRRWIQMISLIRKKYPTVPVTVVGVGCDEKKAICITSKTESTSITNTSLQDVADIAMHAKAIITNDTMMAHLGISFGKPVIIVANGGNCFIRFTNYKEAGIGNVCTIYPAFFTKKRKHVGDNALQNHIASSSDMSSIRAKTVFNALQEVLC